MMKDIPILLGFDPKKVVGHMSIYDGELLQLLLNATPTASPDFSFGWQVNYSSLTIGAVSLNLRSAEPDEPKIQESKKCFEPDFKKRAHNLNEARAYYDKRVKAIQKNFSDEIWSTSSLNWPQWDKFRVLLCNIYGVSCVDQIPDEYVKDANVTAINMLAIMFDKNIQMLERKQKMMEDLR